MWETIGPKWQAIVSRKKKKTRSNLSPKSTQKALQDMADGVDAIRNRPIRKKNDFL